MCVENVSKLTGVKLDEVYTLTASHFREPESASSSVKVVEIWHPLKARFTTSKEGWQSWHNTTINQCCQSACSAWHDPIKINLPSLQIGASPETLPLYGACQIWHVFWQSSSHMSPPAAAGSVLLRLFRIVVKITRQLFVMKLILYGVLSIISRKWCAARSILGKVHLSDHAKHWVFYYDCDNS